MAGKVVFAILPKAGLGNKLYVWAKATVFAEVNHADVVTWGWVQPSLGPFLRGERSKRLYIRQFRQSEISDLFVLIKKTWLKDQIIDPPLIKVSDDIFENTTSQKTNFKIVLLTKYCLERESRIFVCF